MENKKNEFTRNIQEMYEINNGVGDIQYYGESFGGTNIDADTAFFKISLNGKIYEVKVCNDNEMLF